MKQGREAFAAVISAKGGVTRAVCKLKGRELEALIHYVEGLTPDDDARDEILGVALIVAAERYLERVRAKAAKKARRARRIL
jgi:hypothetical protein